MEEFNANSQTDTPEAETPSDIPTAEEMFERLHSVDITQFNIKEVAEEMKGKYAWVFVMVMPLAAIFLVTFTMIGTLLTGYFIASFLMAALILFVIGKIFDQYEQKYRYQARLEVMNRIKQTEGDFQLIIHFKDFLPKKYRHLWQSLNKGRYIYIDQYISAISLLQRKLDLEKFKRIWGIRHPEYAIEEEEKEEH